MITTNIKHRWFYLIFWFLFISYNQVSLAQMCDTAMMETRYNKLAQDSKLYQSEGDYWKLVDTVQSILSFQSFVTNCLNTQQNNLTNLEQLLDKFKSLKAEIPISTELQQQKNSNAQHFVSTTFLNNHLKELLSHTTIAAHNANYLNMRSKTTPVLDSIHKVSWSDFTINANALYQQAIFWTTSDMHWLLLISSIIMGSLVIRWHKVKGFSLYKNTQSLFSLMILMAAVLYYYFLLLELRSEYMSLRLVELRYVLYFIVISKLLIILIGRNKASPNEPVIAEALHRSYIVMFLGICGYFLMYLLKAQWCTPALQNILVNTGITLYNLALLWVIWTVFKMDFFRTADIINIRHRSQSLLCLFCIMLISLGWVGYQHAAVLFVPNILITIVTVTIFLDVNQFLKNVYTSLCVPTHPWHLKLYHFLKINQNEKIWELLFLRAILLFMVFSFAILALQQGWGMTLFDTYRHLVQGIIIFNITIYPIRIIQACIAFSIIMLLGRSVSTFIVEHPRFKKEPDLISLIRKLTRCAVCCIAIIIGLIIAGINTTSLTIVSGLLSFGVGWGVKDIVADITSGIYLLFARPIEVGDCIKVDGTEGKICHIGLVSTQIKTFNHYDLFIANSKLIYNTIRNYSFHNNKLYRIKATVAINDKTMVETARQLLMDIATNNPKIVQEKPNEPTVLFEGDVLALRCDVTNTHESDQVLSDLNLTIAQEFTEKKIAFSFK